MRVSLSDYPSYTKTGTITFPKLAGGLNTSELDYRLGNDESPELRNMWWEDGVLQCRAGQTYVTAQDDLGVGHSAFQEDFHNHLFFHIGDKLYHINPQTDTELTALSITGVPENRGTFFRYLDYLFYKNHGGYYRIEYNDSDDSFTVKDMLTDPGLEFIPTIIINANPADCSGNYLQAENRLSPKKRVKYISDGTSTDYYLPLSGVESIVEVKVDGTVLTSGYSLVGGNHVHFTTAPAAANLDDNNVEIVYSKANPAAYNSIMECEYAITGGGNDNLCVIFGGCDVQPNAVFWNSNDQISMNPNYFPVENYNLVGETTDPVTGFGKQYSTLAVFKVHSIGKLDYTVETIDGLNKISFTYNTINPHIGCDLPWTIQTIENNLVFGNTYTGVYIVRSTSAAYENTINCISAKVNGVTEGLLHDIQAATNVTSFDDDSRYWICADDKCYVWDYDVSTFTDPSWFYFTNINAKVFLRDYYHNMYHLNPAGRVTKFERNFSDYDQGIDKYYRFPTQFMDSYDRLKNVLYCIISVRSDTNTDVTVTYDTDYETRNDLTNIYSYHYQLVPRNLTNRNLSVFKYAKVAKRTPGCKHVRHFSLSLSNSELGQDLAIATAQIFYRFQGRER